MEGASSGSNTPFLTAGTDLVLSNEEILSSGYFEEDDVGESLNETNAPVELRSDGAARIVGHNDHERTPRALPTPPSHSDAGDRGASSSASSERRGRTRSPAGSKRGRSHSSQSNRHPNKRRRTNNSAGGAPGWTDGNAKMEAAVRRAVAEELRGMRQQHTAGSGLVFNVHTPSPSPTTFHPGGAVQHGGGYVQSGFTFAPSSEPASPAASTASAPAVVERLPPRLRDRITLPHTHASTPVSNDRHIPHASPPALSPAPSSTPTRPPTGSVTPTDAVARLAQPDVLSTSEQKLAENQGRAYTTLSRTTKFDDNNVIAGVVATLRELACIPKYATRKVIVEEAIKARSGRGKISDASRDDFKNNARTFLDTAIDEIRTTPLFLEGASSENTVIAHYNDHYTGDQGDHIIIRLFISRAGAAYVPPAFFALQSPSEAEVILYYFTLRALSPAADRRQTWTERVEYIQHFLTTVHQEPKTETLGAYLRRVDAIRSEVVDALVLPTGVQVPATFEKTVVIEFLTHSATLDSLSQQVYPNVVALWQQYTDEPHVPTTSRAYVEKLGLKVNLERQLVGHPTPTTSSSVAAGALRAQPDKGKRAATASGGGGGDGRGGGRAARSCYHCGSHEHTKRDCPFPVPLCFGCYRVLEDCKAGKSTRNAEIVPHNGWHDCPVRVDKYNDALKNFGLKRGQVWDYVKKHGGVTSLRAQVFAFDTSVDHDLQG